MAIDTTEKKLALIGYGMPFRLMLPEANGSIDVGDEQHLLGLYPFGNVIEILGGRIVAGFAYIPGAKAAVAIARGALHASGFIRGVKAGFAFTRGAPAGHAFIPGTKAGLGRSS